MEDLFSEACMQVVAEYCGSSQGAQDGGCEMIGLVFHRVAG
jgi:hypothetical protein